METNLPAHRFPGSSFGCSDEPEFVCGNRDCRNFTDEPVKCEGCGKLFCSEHVTTVGELPWCDDCRVCSCRGIAVALCADCGSLTCSMCSRPDGKGGRLCDACKHNPDPDDLPAEAYDADNARCL